MPPYDELDYSVLPLPGKIRELRKVRGLSQEALSERALVGKRTIQKAEAGKRVWKESLVRMANALGVDVDELIAPHSEAVVFTQEMLEAIPLPVFFKDAQGIYRGCNEQFCNYLNREREFIIGKNVYELSPKDLAVIYKSRDDDLLENPGRQIYQASVVAGREERRVVFFKGTFPINGKAEGIIGVIVDITDYTDSTPDRIRKK
jgi:transcriptional regulator with XRE-family HTH domain